MNYPIFRKKWYIDALKQGPIALFNRIKLDVKWAYQRVQRGFSDYDAGDVDVWFENVIPGIITVLKENVTNNESRGLTTDEDIEFYEELLKQFNISKVNFSCWNSDEVSDEVLNQIQDKLHQHWIDILDKLIVLLVEMNEDECSKKEELSYEELINYCNHNRKEAFEMLNKYFHSLWL